MTPTISKRYSQNEEQDWIALYTPDHGRFLDIGAWNAKQLSNTRALYECGWGGVLIEPSPGPFRSLQHEYDGITGIVLINAAVGLTDGEVEMWMTDDAVSTSDPHVHSLWQAAGGYKEKRTVRQITLDRIYQICGDFDFVNIDAEGMSVSLFDALLELGKRPSVICVEYDSQLDHVLTNGGKYGYAEVYRSGENLVLVKQ